MFGINWKRDLTTNRASTQESDADRLLRPVRSSTDLGDVVHCIEEFEASEPAWSILSSEARTDNAHVVHLVRTTRWFRFKDDVVARIHRLPASSPQQGGVQVDITSASRIGKADFGQNPRNIRELNRHLKAHLPAADALDPHPNQP